MENYTNSWVDYYADTIYTNSTQSNEYNEYDFLEEDEVENYE